MLNPFSTKPKKIINAMKHTLVLQTTGYNNAELLTLSDVQ